MQVSFDEYLCDRPRVFRAMFPDKRRSKRLNDVSPFRLCFRPSAPTVTTGSLQEEWRIQMLPIHFLFASANPVVVMRLRHKSSGEDYPPGVPGHATSVLELQAVISWIIHLRSQLSTICSRNHLKRPMCACRPGGSSKASRTSRCHHILLSVSRECCIQIGAAAAGGSRVIWRWASA